MGYTQEEIEKDKQNGEAFESFLDELNEKHTEYLAENPTPLQGGIKDYFVRLVKADPPCIWLRFNEKS
ncbi:MAG TPA: hypothetical protein VF476_11675, partial [Chitinophagaceae bacterium]